MTTKVRFGADEYTLKASWAASMEFADKIRDPLILAQESFKGNSVFEAKDMVMAIWIGLKHAGEKFTFEEVGNLCYEHGLVSYLPVAISYLVDIVSNGNTEEAAPAKKAKKTG